MAGSDGSRRDSGNDVLMRARVRLDALPDVRMIRTLANVLEARDRGTGDHSTNVARLGMELWRVLTGEEPDEDLAYGFMLHDVGKVSIPDAVLLKDGPLTVEEMAIMRGHVDVGVHLVEPLGFRPVVFDIIRHHHERWDGMGYPSRLRGEEIPLAARAFSVVDSYDAMTSDRPYRPAMTQADALRELSRAAGTQFDPACVEAFMVLALRHVL